MASSFDGKWNRRNILKSSLALVAGGAASRLAEAEPEIKNVNRASSPSDLKITDMRYAVIVKPGPSPCVLIRIDTNQDVYGLGEVRDIAGPQYAMVLKSRILGENPLRIVYLFQKIAQFGGNARQDEGKFQHSSHVHEIWRTLRLFSRPEWLRRPLGRKSDRRILQEARDHQASQVALDFPARAVHHP